jgi:hypothetical protein
MNSMEAQEIINRVARVDWYYHYSDDYSVWKAGEQSMKEIKAFAKSRDWTDDDIETLKLAVFNMVNLKNYHKEEDRQKSIDAWEEKINDLFKKKEIKQ